VNQQAFWLIRSEEINIPNLVTIRGAILKINAVHAECSQQDIFPNFDKSSNFNNTES
jgi:hypothetical protein